MKLRVFVTGLILVHPALAQTPQACSDCTPISGKVVDATNGKPLAGAVVHYRGAGGLRQDDVETNPPTIQGTVTTGEDGTFTLPLLPPGPFNLRASAEGYLAGAHWNIYQRRKGAPPERPTPIPAKICRQATGKDSCGNVPSLYDATIELHPDPLHLTTMSDEALKGFALPMGLTSREYGAAAFSADGTKLAFFTRDAYSPPLVGDLVLTPFRRSVLWIYSLTDGKLTAVEIDNEVEIEASPNPIIAWNGDDFYLSFGNGDASPFGHGLYLVREEKPRPVARPVALKDLPIAVRQAVSNESARSGASTTDGRFTFDSEEDDNGCTTLNYQAAGTAATKRITNGCRGFEYLLDRSHDRVLYTGTDANAERGQRWPLVSFGEFDLKTEAKRLYWLPETHGERQILASAEQAHGGTRVAYAVDGDCNPAGSDYAQPYAPDGELGPTPNRFSVCFVTFPVAAVAK